jgi:tRNA A-37 threonylcarbamoyl transferase component Bud32
LSEAEVTLKYREWPFTVTHYILLGLVPVLGLFILSCWLSALTLQAGSAAQFGNIAIFLSAVMMLGCFLIWGIIVTADNTIFLARDGMSFPFLVCPGSKMRTQQHWSDLIAVNFVPRGRRGMLCLKFKNGQRVRLHLDMLSPELVENLIVSMDVWSGGADMFPSLLDARLKLLETDKGASESLPGYTEMWEDELARRFGATNFIPLEPREKVRELTIERQLAFGGMSAIYLATGADNRKCVLKEAVVPSDADAKLRETAEHMLVREAQILAGLSHPNIARVLDHFLENGRHYIMMELIDGADLRRLVKEHGRQSEADVAYWALQLADILAYLHAQQPPIVHRDLSPDNLMLRESGELCLIDFGAANHFVGTATGTLIGKQAYIAPEQLRGKAEPRSDIYAFGGTLFFLLTGEDPEPLSVAHVREVNRKVSEKLDQIIARCTAQEEEERPATALELAGLLRPLAKEGANAKTV